MEKLKKNTIIKIENALFQVRPGWQIRQLKWKISTPTRKEGGVGAKIKFEAMKIEDKSGYQIF